MSTRYTDTYYLRKSGEYPNAKNDADILPIPYGDLRIGTGPIWKCVLIDTTIHQYLVADCQINTSNITLYDSDETDITSGAVLSNSSGITTATFGSDQGEVYARGTGKLSGGALIDNPIDIIKDILDDAGYGDLKLTTTQIARDQCDTLGYVAAGVLVSDRSINEIIGNIMGSFVGFAYTDDENKLVLGLSTEVTQYTLRGYLAERKYDGSESVTFEIDNIVNQAECYYGKIYVEIDRRFKEGVRDNYYGYNDGSSTCDAESQNSYGVRKRQTPFVFDWVYSVSVLETIQERIVANYAAKRGVFQCVEQSFSNFFADVGQYCLFSTRLLLDENKFPLRNQIGLILEKSQKLEDRSVGFKILDTGFYLGEDPPLLDGAMILDGTHTLGGNRNRRIMI